MLTLAPHNPLFSFAKDIAKRSSLLMQVSHVLRKRRCIVSLAELDAFFDDFVFRYPTIEDIDSQAVLQLLDVYYVEPELRLPVDPFSQEYREKQWDFFMKLHGKDHYDISDEGNIFDFQKNKDNFYPYNLQSAERANR